MKHTESTTALQHEIQRLDQQNYELDQTIRNAGRRKRLNDKEIMRLKDQLIATIDGAAEK